MKISNLAAIVDNGKRKKGPTQVFYMTGYVISGMCILSGAYLSSVGASGWPWFLAAGTFMFMLAVGVEMKDKEQNRRA